jgi:hypothetical protein
MAFVISGNNSAGTTKFTAANAKDAVDRVLAFETLGYQSIVVKDSTSRTINLDELSALCVESED